MEAAPVPSSLVLGPVGGVCAMLVQPSSSPHVCDLKLLWLAASSRGWRPIGREALHWQCPAPTAHGRGGQRGSGQGVPEGSTAAFPPAVHTHTRRPMLQQVEGLGCSLATPPHRRASRVWASSAAAATPMVAAHTSSVWTPCRAADGRQLDELTHGAVP